MHAVQFTKSELETVRSYVRNDILGNLPALSGNETDKLTDRELLALWQSHRIDYVATQAEHERDCWPDRTASEHQRAATETRDELDQAAAVLGKVSAALEKDRGREQGARYASGEKILRTRDEQAEALGVSVIEITAMRNAGKKWGDLIPLRPFRDDLVKWRRRHPEFVANHFVRQPALNHPAR